VCFCCARAALSASSRCSSSSFRPLSASASVSSTSSIPWQSLSGSYRHSNAVINIMKMMIMMVMMIRSIVRLLPR
jgi:hypothetical protein